MAAMRAAARRLARPDAAREVVRKAVRLVASRRAEGADASRT
jgi:hypothetical protein